ncbi:MAG: hypothetical protein V1760_02890, partial [Candidatus Peregrinibacteria bacterium]
LWGLLDKRAVAVGGGNTHRLSLNDAILVKDNHLLLTPKKFEKQWKRVLKRSGKVRFVELELDNFQDIRTFVEIHHGLPSRLKSRGNIIVMLDNFAPVDIKKAVKLLKPTGATIEVSGGITADNIRRYAVSGVSAISSGAITMRAPSLDLSLEITP